MTPFEAAQRLFWRECVLLCDLWADDADAANREDTRNLMDLDPKDMAAAMTGGR